MTAPTTYCDECGASNPLQATCCFACNTALQLPAPSPLLPVHTASANAAMLLRETRGGPLVPSYLLHSRYSIVSQVGTGGFGAVYQAHDTLFSHRLVAIKEMSQDGLSPRELAEASAAFEREALVLTNLTHPNLPRIHDHFSEHGRSYVVMDFIAGGTLEDSLDTSHRSFPVEVVLNIGLQLAEALYYLHTHQPPIIFRDLKPANIMRTADNHVYLIDFGIARHFKPGKAKDTIPLGSKGYAAPEQYGKAQTTPQSDIYGLGATLHQLLTGDDPSLSLFHFQPVQLRKSPISTQLNALLQQMLEMEMSKRPASMAVVKQELQHLLAQQTVPMPGPAQQIAQARAGRRRFLRGCASVVAVCGGSGAITAYLLAHPNLWSGSATHPLIGDTPAATPVPYPGRTTIRSEPLYTYRGHDGAVTAVAWSPQGQHIASAGALDLSVQVWDANTGNIVLIPTLIIDTAEHRLPTRKKVPALFATGTPKVDALAWSPDSTRIASPAGNGSVEAWNIETGDGSFFPFNQTGNANALAWSPDGSSIAAVSGNTNVEVRSATTGERFFTNTGHSQAVLTLAWSPDGKRIASGDAGGTVQVWDPATGDTLGPYSGFAAEVNAVAWSPDGKYIASGGSDGAVQVWDPATGIILVTYSGHSGRVNTIAWGIPLLPSYEARIASGASDNTVQVWSFGSAANTQAMALQGDVLIYRGHSGPVTSVTWAPDGQRVASGSEDGTVQVWRAV
jgi:eukaryotic-like serine/threonine-protein kinase